MALSEVVGLPADSLQIVFVASRSGIVDPLTRTIRDCLRRRAKKFHLEWEGTLEGKQYCMLAEAFTAPVLYPFVVFVRGEDVKVMVRPSDAELDLVLSSLEGAE